MKKKKIHLQKLKVESFVTDGKKSDLRGGAEAITGGCTDGCTGSDFLCTYWNCTRTACTADCEPVIM